MNEPQHQAANALEVANAAVKRKTFELNAAKRAQYRARKTLRQAVSRDPESWYGTTRIDQDTNLPIDLRNR